MASQAALAKAALSNPIARNMAANQAKNLANEGASGLSSYLKEENFWSLKILSFFSGLTMFVLCILKMFFGVLGALTSPFDYTMTIYFVMFSWVVVTENAKDSWPYVQSTRAWTEENFGIYRTNFGRGFMMVFLGLLWVETSDGLVKIFGWILVGLGAVYFISNYICCCCAQEKPAAAVEQQPQAQPDVERGVTKQGTNNFRK